MRVTYTNYPLRTADHGDVLLTDEVLVAEGAPPGVRVLRTDALLDPDEAQALNVEILRAAFDWFRATGQDPTIVDGISAGDLAGSEVAITLLMPAARGWLGVAAAFRPGGPLEGQVPERIIIHAPEPPAPEARRYRALEALQCDGAAQAVRARFGDSVAVERRGSEPANAVLQQKYAQTRDWTWLVPQTRFEHLRQIVPAHVLNATAALRGRRGDQSLLVYEYNPTNAFAEQYSARADPRMRLVRCRTPRADLPQIVARADRLVVPPRTIATASRDRDGRAAALARYVRDHDTAYRERLRLRDLDLWPLIRRRLMVTLESYRAFAQGGAARWRLRLRRGRVQAVVVPFDTPPEARLLVAVAQAAGIPTFLVNDGFKADDFSVDGMTIDHVLAWSDALAENYYARRRGAPAIVTGNPKADAQRALRARRVQAVALTNVLVGSFTFSPVDLNCRRSDSESFLRDVLVGIRTSAVARRARVRVKLHPADRPDYYRPILDALPELNIELVTRGDVVGEFDAADIYITTYSTSLLEAMAQALPVIYYSVNPQRLHPPFSGDALLEARTARSAAELAALLDDPSLREPLAPEDREAWVQRYLGATDGRSFERIEGAILSVLRGRRSATG